MPLTHYIETEGSTSTFESHQKLVESDEPRPKSRSSSTVSSLQPYKTLMDRRPSAGANIQIPHAALCQHRHSLQLNGDTGLPRGGSERSSPRSFHRIQKTPEKTRKHLFGTLQKEPPRRFSESDDDMSSSLYTTPRGSLGGSSLSTTSPRASIQQEPINHCSSKVGVVITSYRQSQRSLDPDTLWSSTSSAAAAFAIATSAPSNPRDEPPEVRSANRKESVVSSPATMRVLNVLRHWVSKHFQDFEQDVNLRSQAIVFLEDITCSPNLLPSEHRAASQLLRLLVRDDLDSGRQQLETLLAQPLTASKDSIETLSALEIAEQMTYLDHQIFMNIRSEEFLGQSLMKSNKKTRAEHIILMTKRFNDGSRLVSSEIISRSDTINSSNYFSHHTSDHNNDKPIPKQRRSSSYTDTDLETLDRELNALDASMPLVDPEITQGAEQLEKAISRKRSRTEDDNDRLVREALSQFYLPSPRLLSGIDDCPGVPDKRYKTNDLDFDLNLDHNQNQKEFDVIMDALRLGSDSCGQAAMMSESGVFHNLVVASLET